MLETLFNSPLFALVTGGAGLLFGALFTHLLESIRGRRERETINRQEHPYLHVESPKPVELQSRIDALSALRKSEVILMSVEATLLEDDPVDQAQRDASLKPTVKFKSLSKTTIPLVTNALSSFRIIYIENTNSSTCTLMRMGYIFNGKTCEKNIPAQYKMLSSMQALIIVVDEGSSPVQISHIITEFRTKKYICKNLQDKLCVTCYFSEYKE